jgi:hypothetical protein
MEMLEILPSPEQNNPPRMREPISVLGEDAMLERLGVRSTSIEPMLFIERKCFPTHGEKRAYTSKNRKHPSIFSYISTHSITRSIVNSLHPFCLPQECHSLALGGPIDWITSQCERRIPVQISKHHLLECETEK